MARPSRKYFGNAGHLIVSDKCRFHLTTQVGQFLVSTVGEYWPERSSREIHAKYADAAWLAANGHRKGDDFDHAYMQRFGFMTIGSTGTYETMVFKIGKGACSCGCGLPKVADWSELECNRYDDAAAATKGHEAKCRKYEVAGHSSLRKTKKARRGS